jgi:hypothetical protein
MTFVDRAVHVHVSLTCVAHMIALVGLADGTQFI